jgi:predicted phosphodiesterase
MRVAVIADVHGNRLALAAVLDAIAAAAPDLVIELGDAVSGPLWPAECFEMLHELDAVAVRGNHDRWVAAEAPEGLGATDVFAWHRLSDDQRAALHARPMAWRDGGILAAHSLPDDDLTYVLHEVTPEGVRERAHAGIAALLPPLAGESLVLTAHTHRARMVTLPDGRLVMNPGSVGLPGYSDTEPHPHRMEAGTPHARFALLEQTRGAWRVEFHAIPYDWHAAAAQAARHGRDDWAQALAHGTLS